MGVAVVFTKWQYIVCYTLKSGVVYYFLPKKKVGIVLLFLPLFFPISDLTGAQLLR